MKQLLFLSLFLISLSCFAQTNSDKAKLCYYKAEEQFQAGNYQTCIDKLNEAIQLLGKSNARIQYLMVKSYKGLENYKQVKIELGKYFSFKPDEDEWFKEMLMLSEEIDALIKQKDDAEALKKKQQEEIELQVKKQKEADEAAAKKKKEDAELLIKQDNEAWAVATSLNTELSFQNYIDKFPKGKHVQDAKLYLDNFTWVSAKTQNTKTAYENYIKNYPSGLHSAEAKEIIDNFYKMVDARDGKTYRIVEIGTQWWMAENLAYKPVEGKYWAYNNDPNNVKTYGYLYNRKTACEVCPDGWHLPSKDEWWVMINYLGGEKVADAKLKSKNGWKNNGTNESGFNALPGGARYHQVYYGVFIDIGIAGAWWTATKVEEMWDTFYFQRIYNDTYPIESRQDIKNQGFSVRCIKDK